MPDRQLLAGLLRCFLQLPCLSKGGCCEKSGLKSPPPPGVVSEAHDLLQVTFIYIIKASYQLRVYLLSCLCQNFKHIE